MNTTHLEKTTSMKNEIIVKCDWGELPVKEARAHMINLLVPEEGDDETHGCPVEDIIKHVSWLLINEPIEIVRNAHRIHDWLTEMCLINDSGSREWCFAYASAVCGIPYEDLYDAYETGEEMTNF